MKKTINLFKLWRLIYVIITIGCLASCSNNIYFGKGFFAPGQTSRIKTENWAKVKIGMTKKEVVDVLGDSPSKHVISVDSSKKKSNTLEFWEYEYRSSLLSEPHPKAYVIYFTKEDLVSKIREPIK